MNLIQRLLFCILLLSVARTVHSQNHDEERIAKFLAAKSGLKTNAAHDYLQTLFPEWDLKKMKHICMMIGDRTPAEAVGGKFNFLIEQRFYEAAKVDTKNDNEEATAKKISAMWKVYQQTGYTGCNSSTFDVRDGNILKYAVADKFDEFLQDAVKWKLDLNKVDLYDQMTLLDYIDYNLLQAKGSAFESKYQ